MIKLILSAGVLLATVSQATENKIWPEVAHCTAEVSYILVNEPDFDKSFMSEKKDILITLQPNEFGKSSGMTSIILPDTNSRVDLNLEFTNYDEAKKPSAEKVLDVYTLLLVEDKIAGSTSARTKETDKASFLINMTNLRPIDFKAVHKYRFSNPANRFSTEEAIKVVFPGKEIMVERLSVGCTVYAFDVKPVDPKF